MTETTESRVVVTWEGQGQPITLQVNTIGGTIPDDEFDALVEIHSEMEYEIRDTHSTSIEAIAGKVRIAWRDSVVATETIRNGPDETFAPLDPRRFVWSALQDLERLAGEAPRPA